MTSSDIFPFSQFVWVWGIFLNVCRKAKVESLETDGLYCFWDLYQIGKLKYLTEYRNLESLKPNDILELWQN